MAQSVKHPTLDFGAGYDLMVPEVRPHVLCLSAQAQSLLGILSLSPPPLLSLSLSLKINKIHIKNKKMKKEEQRGRGDSSFPKN